MTNIPPWVLYILAGAVVIALIVVANQYYEAAASLESLLPGEGGG